MTDNINNFFVKEGKEKNIVEYFTWQVRNNPHKKAIIISAKNYKSLRTYSHLTFLQLEKLINSYSFGLSKNGVLPGMRVLMAIKPSMELIALTFALFKVGAIPIFIDPGMKKKDLLKCIEEAKASVLLANFTPMLLTYFYKKSFSNVKTFINTSSWQFGKIKSIQKFPFSDEFFEAKKTMGSDTAAILYTSGSTGRAKGVIYTHNMFCKQVDLIQKYYKRHDDEIDMSIFPLFALFALSLGMTTVIPNIDFSKPLKVNPLTICNVIQDQGVSFSFGSPTFWYRVGNFCKKNNIQLNSLKKVLMAGCSVSGKVHELFLGEIISPAGDIYVPYGATEALPVASFTGSESLSETHQLSLEGKGTCVGYVFEENDVKIIKITDEEIDTWQSSLEIAKNEIGEIVVKGLIVSNEYFEQEQSTKLAKIKEGRYIWHRMGDLGYIDDQNRLWFCGRKKERIITETKELYTDQCENIFNEHKLIFRTALVGIGKDNQIPTLIIEPINKKILQDKNLQNQIIEELKNLAIKFNYSEIDNFMFKDSFPVDVRHNAKIKRDLLQQWAKQQQN